MSFFKDMVERDNGNVFMNLDELGEEHIINGKTVRCVLQEKTIMAVDQLRFMSQDTVILFALEADFPERVAYSGVIRIDDVQYETVSWNVEFGMVTAELVRRAN